MSTPNDLADMILDAEEAARIEAETCPICDGNGSLDGPVELIEWCDEPEWCNCPIGQEARAEYANDLRDREEEEREIQRSWR